MNAKTQVFFTWQKRQLTPTKALTDHPVEAQTAQKKVKEQEACVTAGTAPFESFQCENAKPRSENSGLKNLNEELMQKAIFALQYRGAKKIRHDLFISTILLARHCHKS